MCMCERKRESKCVCVRESICVCATESERDTVGCVCVMSHHTSMRNHATKECVRVSVSL